MNRIRTLTGLVPFCMHSKKIRDKKDQLEKHVGEHSGTVFNHAICEDCHENFYPESPESNHDVLKDNEL